MGTHANAPLSVEGRRRLVERCQSRPIAHVAAEMGISRACASKWVNRYRRHGELGPHDRSSTPHRQPTATPGEVVERIEQMRRNHKWSAGRIAFELSQTVHAVSRRTITRHLAHLGLSRRRFIDPDGHTTRKPRTITARRPGHMVHIDVKKVGRIPDGGGCRAHGRNSDHSRAASRNKKKTGRGGYVYLRSAVDGHTRLAYTEPSPDEKPRNPARPSAGGVEHPLQLPPTPHRPRRTSTRSNTQADRHQRHGLIHLVRQQTEAEQHSGLDTHRPRSEDTVRFGIASNATPMTAQSDRFRINVLNVHHRAKPHTAGIRVDLSLAPCSPDCPAAGLVSEHRLVKHVEVHLVDSVRAGPDSVLYQKFEPVKHFGLDGVRRHAAIAEERTIRAIALEFRLEGEP